MSKREKNNIARMICYEKHKIKCDEHQAINKLQLVRNNGKWRYKYSCCSLGML